MTPEHKPTPGRRTLAAMPYRRRPPFTTKAKVTQAPRVSEIELALRRKKHADAERIRSHRKEGAVVRMRACVDELERTFEDLKQQQIQERRLLAKSLGTDIQLSPVERARTDYVDSLAMSGHLRREKLFLQARIQDLGIVNTALETVLMDFNVPSTTAEDVEELVGDECDCTIRPAQCHAIMRELFDESEDFEVVGRPMSTGCPALGWSDKRALKNATDVSFCLTKVIQGQDMEQMMHNTWRAFQSFELSHKVFCAMTKLRRVQRISDDMFVLRQTIQFGSGNLSYPCLNFVFRVKTDTGYLIGCRTLPEPMEMSLRELSKVVKEEASEQSTPMNMSCWIRFDEAQHGDCQVTFAGRTGNGTPEFAQFMLVEMPITVLRWENMIAGPLVQLS